MKSPHIILGIGPKANKTKVKEAFHKLAKQYHPDTYQGDKAYATTMFKEINQAYQTMIKRALPEVKGKVDIYRVVEATWSEEENLHIMNIFVADEIAKVGARVFTIVNGFGDIDFELPAGVKNGQYIMLDKTQVPSHRPMKVRFVVTSEDLF